MSYEITMNTGKIKIIFIAVIAIAVVAVMGAASIQIVPAGYRGVLLHWSAVDTSQSMSEGPYQSMSSNDSIIGTTLTGVTGLLGIGILQKAASKLNDGESPEDFPKKKSKKEKTWY